MNTTGKSLGLALAFALELAMLAAFGYWGFHVGSTILLKILLGISTPVLIAVIWAVFMAPRSKRRLQGWRYTAVKIVLFGLAALALIVSGQPAAGIIFGALFLISLRWSG